MEPLPPDVINVIISRFLHLKESILYAFRTPISNLHTLQRSLMYSLPFLSASFVSTHSFFGFTKLNSVFGITRELNLSFHVVVCTSNGCLVFHRLSLTSHYWKSATPRQIRYISNYGWQTRHPLSWQINLEGLCNLTTIEMDTYDQYHDTKFDEDLLATFLSKQTRLKVLILHFMIGRSWLPKSFQNALPSSIVYLKLRESNFNVELARTVVASCPNLRALSIEESRERGRFGQPADMSEMQIIFGGLHKLEALVFPAMPDWSKLPPPPVNLRFLKVPDMFTRERRHYDFEEPVIFLELAVNKFAAWPKPLRLNAISATLTYRNVHVLNWMITHHAPLDDLIEVCRVQGVQPLQFNDPLVAEWMSCEASIFSAIEANSLPVVKWLIEEIKVPIDPDNVKFNNQSIFSFALSVGNLEICDYLFHKVAPQLGLSMDYIFSNFSTDRIPIEGIDPLPPAVCAAQNKYVGETTILDWLLDEPQFSKLAIDVTQVDFRGRHALFHCRHTSVDRLSKLGLDINTPCASFMIGSTPRVPVTALQDACTWYHAPKPGSEDLDGLKIQRLLAHPSFAPCNKDIESILRLAIYRGNLEPLKALRRVAKDDEEYAEMLSYNLPQNVWLSASVDAITYLISLQPPLPAFDQVLQRDVESLVGRIRRNRVSADIDSHTMELIKLLRAAGKGHIVKTLDDLLEDENT